MIRQEIQDFLPAIVLENFCLETGINMPNFQLLGAEGVVHAPVFAYKVSISIDNIEAVDTGQSKKKARHAAAHGALIQLLKRGKEYLKDCPELTFDSYKETDEYLKNCGPSMNEFTLKAGYLFLKKLEKQIVDYQTPSVYDQNQINSVGKLQEVCMKNKWIPPTYDIIDDVNTGHEKIFTMICEIKINDEILNEKGQGRSKKEAKRSSALKMLNVLESKGLFSFVEETDDLNKRLKKLDDGYTNQFVPAQMKIDQFCSALESDLNKELNNLLKCLDEIDLDFCDKLRELALYIECEIDYIDFLPLDDELLTHSSLVSLTPYHNCPPILTGWGQSPVSLEESRNQAARTALELFSKIRYVNDPIMF